MGFGQNAFNWFLGEAQPIVLISAILFAVYFGFKRETSKLVTFLIVACISLFIVFNPLGFKDFLLSIVNKVFGV